MAMKTLSIAPGLKLPLEALEDVTAILGRRGRGKTTTAAVMVEELHKAGARFCVADPTGVWWGVKSSRDGKAPGIPCVVMNGEHGDVPLAPESGEIIADFVADPSSPSVVLDLKPFTQGEMVRFMTAFLSRLYHRNQRPLHLVLDEADQFAPQRAMPGEQAMLGAAQRVTKMGRAKGLHPILITQRPATLSKNVLTQAGLLIAHAITGPQDRKAIDEWIKANAEEGERDTFLAELASLPRGTAYFWSPDLPLFRQVAVRDRETFDSSATPKQGERTVQPKALAEVDLDGLRQRIAATIERAKAEDPRELRRQLADMARKVRELEGTLSRKATSREVGKLQRVVEKPVLKDAQVKRLDGLLARMEKVAIGVQAAAAVVDAQGREIKAALAAARAQQEVRHESPVTSGGGGPGHGTRRLTPVAPRAAARQLAHAGNGDGRIERQAERKVLTVLANYPQGRTGRQLAILAGYAHSGGGFRNAVGRMRTLGYLEGTADRLTITAAGLDALGPIAPLPTGQALQEHWLRELKRAAERRVLEVLLADYPQAVPVELVAERAGYEVSGGGFRNAVGKLRTLDLVAGRGELRASDDLFGEPA